MIVAYIDAHRAEFGVEPICRVLTAHGCKIAPSTYYARKTAEASARAVRDAVMLQVLMALWSRTGRSTALTSCGRPPAGRGMTSAGTRSPG